jgi:hypothetical protein
MFAWRKVSRSPRFCDFGLLPIQSLGVRSSLWNCHMSRAYTIRSFDHDPSSSNERSIHPLIPMFLSGAFFCVAVTAVFAAAMLLGREGLRQRPPHLSWLLVSTYFGGMLLALALNLTLVGWLRGWRPWITDMQVWRRMLSPFAWIALACMLPMLLNFQNFYLTLTLVSMSAMMVLGLLPTFVCLADFVQFLPGTMHEKVQLRPLASSDLPAGARAWFDENTPKLIRQGFRQLGDYRLKQSSPLFARFFLSANGESFAEISYVQLLFKRVKCVSYFSLTNEGYYLESSNLGFAGKRKAIAKFEALRMPGRPLNEIYQLHVDRLKQLQKGRLRTLQVEELEPVIHYGNKRLYEMLIDQQMATINPYADFDDTSVLRPASATKTPTESMESILQVPAGVIAAWETTAGIDIPVS